MQETEILTTLLARPVQETEILTTILARPVQEIIPHGPNVYGRDTRSLDQSSSMTSLAF